MLDGSTVIENKMVWDLSHLVETTDPKSVRQDLDSMVAEAEKVRSMYHGRIRGLDAKGLLELLELRDTFTLKFEGVVRFCQLMYEADSTDNIAKQLNDTARKALMKVERALAFIDIELGKLLTEKPSLVTNATLAEYKHYLERILRKAPHMLSEIEERLTIIKDKNGIKAWEMLQSDWLSTRTFEIEIKGEKKTLEYGQIIGFYQSSDRDLRKRANQTVYDSLGKDEIVWASALRAVCETTCRCVSLESIRLQ
jgi:oligoendopeptidase F